MKVLSGWCSALTALLGLGLGGGVVKAQSRNDPDVKSVPLRTHSLYQPYLDSDLQSRWFDWGGDTVIRADSYIRLTGDRQEQSGWIWSRLPLTATNWELEVEFKIHGQGHLYGDGLALWVTKQRATEGPVFGSQDNFEGLGIFIDTYKNNRPGTVFPYVMAMLGDGKTSYNHANDGKDQEAGGCSARGIRGNTNPTRLRLTYFQENYLNLDLLYKDQTTWTTCFNIPNVTLPTVSYLGFSAHCGELSDNHDIIFIGAQNLYSTKSSKASNSAGSPRPMGSKQSSASGGWGWFFVKLVLFIVVCVGGYLGWVAYRVNKRSSRF
ncbi:legume-like lectin family-domain-containing protein [Tirmania nivea]|nr:legume-like lectin family-domain-containing protein [Tirmania nivea]